jgi:hypothetical protein
MTIEITGKDRYEWVNGKKPRGFGMWLFEFSDEKSKPFRKSFRGTFSDVSQEARKFAKKYGLTGIKLLP